MLYLYFKQFKFKKLDSTYVISIINGNSNSKVNAGTKLQKIENIIIKIESVGINTSMIKIQITKLKLTLKTMKPMIKLLSNLIGTFH